MGVRVVTERVEVRGLLDARLAVDPVTGTVLGTIREALERPESEPWCVTSSAGGLAVRSQAEYPALLDGPWPEGDRPDLVTALAQVPGLVGISGVTGVVDPVARALGKPTTVQAMRLHRLDRLTAPADVPGTARRAGPPDRDLLVGWYDAFGLEAHMRIPEVEWLVDKALVEGGCWLWLDADGIPVSLATRQAVVAGSARTGPVYTPAAQRRRGYGSAVTAAATQDILDDAAVPVLFTDLANPTSNKIYRTLGYFPVEDRTAYRFDSAPTRSRGI